MLRDIKNNLKKGAGRMGFLKITALTGAVSLAALLGYKYVTADPPGYCSAQDRYISDGEFLKASIALYEWDMNRDIKVYPDGVIKKRRDYGASYGYWERTRHRTDCCDIVRLTHEPLGRMFCNQKVEVRLYTGASRGDSQARFYFNVCGALIPSDDSFLGSGSGGITTTEIINSKTGANHGYDWAQLSVKEITNFFLYGAQTGEQEYSKGNFIDAGANNEWRLAA